MSVGLSAVQPPNALGYGMFVKAAYDVFAALPDNLNPAQSQYPSFPAGYQLILNIQMTDFFGDSDYPKYYGFIAQSIASPNKYVAALRGTIKWYEWWDDFHIELVECPYLGGSGYVEDGFLELYQSISGMFPGQTGNPVPLQDKLNLPDGTVLDSSTSLVITGHSLGAAVATLYAADISASYNPAVYTLASPKVGDKDFANAYNSAISSNYRIYNKPDLVPNVPISLDPFDPYEHVKGGYEVNSLNYPEVKESYGCYHSLDTYLFLLGANASILGSCGT